MILNFRGTYGSGKTYLARRIMEVYGEAAPHMIEGRKKPLYYTFTHPDGGPDLAVVGSYETVCGGCDTINDAGTIFETVDYLQRTGYDVLYESLLLTADVGRTSRYFLDNLWDLHVILLDVSPDECIASVNERRAARGKMEPVNPKNLMIKVSSAASSCRTLESKGVPVYRLDRDAAFLKALELLNVNLL